MIRFWQRRGGVALPIDEVALTDSGQDLPVPTGVRDVLLERRPVGQPSGVSYGEHG